MLIRKEMSDDETQYITKVVVIYKPCILERFDEIHVIPELEKWSDRHYDYD